MAGLEVEWIGTAAAAALALVMTAAGVLARLVYTSARLVYSELRGRIERTERGLTQRTGAVGRLLTDYEVHLTRKGRGLLEGALPEEPGILVGEL